MGACCSKMNVKNIDEEDDKIIASVSHQKRYFGCHFETLNGNTSNRATQKIYSYGSSISSPSPLPQIDPANNYAIKASDAACNAVYPLMRSEQNTGLLSRVEAESQGTLFSDDQLSESNSIKFKVRQKHMFPHCVDQGDNLITQAEMKRSKSCIINRPLSIGSEPQACEDIRLLRRYNSVRDDQLYLTRMSYNWMSSDVNQIIANADQASSSNEEEVKHCLDFQILTRGSLTKSSTIYDQGCCNNCRDLSAKPRLKDESSENNGTLPLITTTDEALYNSSVTEDYNILLMASKLSRYNSCEESNHIQSGVLQMDISPQSTPLLINASELRNISHSESFRSFGADDIVIDLYDSHDELSIAEEEEDDDHNLSMLTFHHKHSPMPSLMTLSSSYNVPSSTNTTSTSSTSSSLSLSSSPGSIPFSSANSDQNPLFMECSSMFPRTSSSCYKRSPKPSFDFKVKCCSSGESTPMFSPIKSRNRRRFDGDIEDINHELTTDQEIEEILGQLFH